MSLQKVLVPDKKVLKEDFHHSKIFHLLDLVEHRKLWFRLAFNRLLKVSTKKLKLLKLLEILGNLKLNGKVSGQGFSPLL